MSRDKRRDALTTKSNDRWDRELKRLRSQLGDRPEAGGAFQSIEDSERHPRSAEEMESEARMFRGVLEAMQGADR